MKYIKTFENLNKNDLIIIYRARQRKQLHL